MIGGIAGLKGLLGRRPIVVALAGPNGAGKTTFFDAHLSTTGLDFVNADDLSLSLSIDPYAAAELADSIRRQLVRERASFVFETVFSDPVGDKIAFLKETERAGYTVVLIFIGVSGANVSGERVAMRASQGGHDVPAPKLTARYPRVLRNLAQALEELPHIFVYDNSDLKRPYRPVAEKTEGGKVIPHKPVPVWLRPLLSRT